MMTVALALIAYLAVVGFVLALLVVAKRSDEAAEREAAALRPATLGPRAPQPEALLRIERPARRTAPALDRRIGDRAKPRKIDGWPIAAGAPRVDPERRRPR